MAITIQEGQSLKDYTLTFGYTEEELRMANPGIGNDVVPGQIVDLPTPEYLNELYNAREEAIRIRPQRTIKEEMNYDRAPAVLARAPISREIPVTLESTPQTGSDSAQIRNDGDQTEYNPLEGGKIRLDTRDVTRGDFPQTTGGLIPLTEEEVSRLPTPEFLAHLKDREGYREDVYLDSLGNPTVGVGHYDPSLKEGTLIPEETLAEYLRQDSQKAWEAAVKQANDVGRTDKSFVEGLASVNFQLGTEWYKEHANTWKLMKEGMWKAAAVEAANSTWNKQTPVRVRDFQKALTNGLK